MTTPPDDAIRELLELLAAKREQESASLRLPFELSDEECDRIHAILTQIEPLS